MPSKRDQLQAHRFLAQRVISALVTRESDPEQPPFRRPGGAAIGSIVIAIIALVGVGVYGLIVPGGNDAWRDGESVIVAEETGTRYVYLNGKLHPVANYASALLALGTHAETRAVSTQSLMGVPRGPRIGIADAPDALPDKNRLLSGGWSLCSQPGPDETGSTVDRSVLLVGTEPTGGAPLGEEALLVEVPASGDQYLIWRGFRHRIRQPDTVAVGLALRSAPSARVGMPLVDVLSAGEPIAPIEVADIGEPSTAVSARPDIRAGQLLVTKTSGGGEQYFLADTDRLRPISQFQYDIQLAYRTTTEAYDGGEPHGIPLGLVAAAQAKQAAAADEGPGIAPPVRPEFAGSGQDMGAICATYAPGASVPNLHTNPRMPPPEEMTGTSGRTEQGMPMADFVHVPPGRGALIEVMPSTEAQAGTLMLVTDQGRAYPLANSEVLDILGYDGVQPARLPAGLVARIPMGSGLDPTAALRT